MRAVLCTRWGGPDDLEIADVAAPVPGAGEVRVAVRAAAVNFADTLMIAGKYQVRPDLPFSPGLELAGEVVETGAGVEGLRKGDRVAAVVDHGAFAEEVVVAEKDAFPLPGSMGFDVAAAFPIAYGTSHVGLTDRAHLAAGETLLVHGAAGGVGLTAVEVGKRLGATVIAAAGSAAKLAVAAEHGADHLIDYSTEDIVARVREITGGKGAEVHYDPVGGKAFEASLRTVPWGGRILIVGFAGGTVQHIPANILLVKQVAAIGFYWGSYRTHAPEILRESMNELFRWHEEGALRPHISHRFPPDRAGEALKTVLERRSSGKVVIQF